MKARYGIAQIERNKFFHVIGIICFCTVSNHKISKSS